MFSFSTYIKSKKFLLFSSLLFASAILVLSLSKPKLSFREITDRLFLEDITTDTLSLHYTLAYPSLYSIDSYPLTLPKYNKDTLTEAYSKIENSLAALSNTDISTLSSEESYCYDLLKDYFSMQQKGFSYTYFEENFSPSSGIICNYPVLMAEYTFRTKQDVTDYLTLLADTENYFSGYLEFQKERLKKGYGLASVSLEETMEQCENIITREALKSNSHFLQLTFKERLALLVAKDIITKKEALYCINKNTEILETVVLPAYQNLKNQLQSLQEEYIPLQGLYQKEQGKEYYQWLVQKQVGCSLSIPEILEKLEADYKKNFLEFTQLKKLIETFDNYEEYALAPFPITDRNELLKILQEFSVQDFPSFSSFLDQPVYATIKSVDSCMEKYTSPAFYMIPPIDDIKQNTIYINNSSTPEGLELFTTLAHEGYPGHLYQTVYYQLFGKENNTPLIRHIMNYNGYVEGWAIYCELYSYNYATKLYPKDMQEFYSLWHKLLSCEKKLQLGILSILDIKLHYYDDSLTTAGNVLSQYGITDKETIEEVHRYVLEEPGNYLKYYMGYLLFMELKEKAETLMGSAYTDYEFHKFVLNTGPSDFQSLEKKLLKQYYSHSG